MRNQLDCVQVLRHFHGHSVRVHTIRPPIAVEAEWRNDRHDPLPKQRPQQFDIDPFDLAGEELIDAANDANWVRVSMDRSVISA